MYNACIHETPCMLAILYNNIYNIFYCTGYNHPAIVEAATKKENLVSACVPILSQQNVAIQLAIYSYI